MHILVFLSKLVVDIAPSVATDMQNGRSAMHSYSVGQPCVFQCTLGRSVVVKAMVSAMRLGDAIGSGLFECMAQRLVESGMKAAERMM